MADKQEPWFTWPLRVAIFVVAVFQQAWRWIMGPFRRKKP